MKKWWTDWKSKRNYLEKHWQIEELVWKGERCISESVVAQGKRMNLFEKVKNSYIENWRSYVESIYWAHVEKSRIGTGNAKEFYTGKAFFFFLMGHEFDWKKRKTYGNYVENGRICLDRCKIYQDTTRIPIWKKDDFVWKSERLLKGPTIFQV